VLIADDEGCLRDLLTEVLEEVGYHVVIAENGQAALSLAEREHPALVLTDCTMPQMDGAGLVHRLRTRPATRGIPVVMMSATRPTSAALGDVPFVEKPFDLDEILDIVAQFTSSASRPDRSDAGATTAPA
jgi:CheY-like chemotaxis protein